VSFISILKTIGNDIEAGIALAGPIIGGFVPAAGPILTDIAAVIADLEGSGAILSPAESSSVLQTLASASTIKQAAAARAKPS
jgi:hypothetical protein